MRLLIAALVAAVGCGHRSAERDREESRAPAPADAAVDGRPQRVVLAEVTARITDGAGGAEDSPDLAAALTGGLVASGWFAATPAEVPADHRPRAARVEVLVGSTLTQDTSDRWSMAAAAEARLTWSDRGGDPAPSDRVLIERELGRTRPDPRSPEVAEAAAAALGQLTAGLAAREAIRSGPAERLDAALGGDDEDLTLWALTVIADHRDRTRVEAVGRLLGSDSRDLRERALGALIAIGDPRGVDAIADHARTDDLGFLRNAIDGVARLGGEDAVSWLEMLVDHPDADIRTQARRALQRLQAGDGGAQSAAPAMP